MSRMLSNRGLGRQFYFFGKFRSKILAGRAEREHPGSFMLLRKGYYYVVKPRKAGPLFSSTTTMRSGIRKRTRTSYKRHRHNPVGQLIYGRVLKIFAEKTEGPYKGQRFVHTFKKGAEMYGMPDGSIRIVHP